MGTWPAVANYLPTDAHENAANCAPILLDARGNIVFSDTGKNISLLGVSDLIVIQTADATLVCHRQEAEKIKQLVAKVPPELQ